MPIKIYSKGNPSDEVAWLCGGDWRLPAQVSALETWLLHNRSSLKGGPYIADVGFSVPQDAGGGGAAMSPETMGMMAEIGIWLLLSEYPCADEK